MPSCARCINSRRTCEGYERYPVFLNRTAQGIDKRHRLDEAKPRFFAGSVQAVISANDWSQALAALANSEMLSQLSAMPAFDSQIIALNFETYMPVNGPSRDHCGRGWLQQAIGLQNPGDALHLSLKAISMKRLGRLCGDDRLAFQGEVCYGTALQQLRKALRSDTVIWHDETLAASFILALYEVSQVET